ncbi:ABC transporter permease [Rhodobium gokarnense]|uniref:Simple sugar transport system permease protein n=1 Tax=Rhodobium gokarnense TaxID=364296 RepID=A0ABT3HHB7_9HYPH|nr:ABC transporter permease [Rhodobium gokarnense]MCW2309804.1 simple sugar transport system permease protein [Rhodobium gokarnense]
MEMFEGIVLTIITAATPLLFAAIGELVTERSGVLNLGVEGMMAVGAVCGFAAAHLTDQPVVAIAAAAAAGALMAALFGVVTLIFVGNQVASGLALTLFGLGLSALIGNAYVGIPGIGLPKLDIPVLTDIPLIGPILFGEDPLTYLAVLLAVGVWWFLFHTRAGLILRAVGDNHVSAHSLGYNVIKVRFLAVMFGGACAGLGGGYLSLVYTPQWTQNMTGGRGWIALALVVFATWLPSRIVIGAVLFGAVSILQLHAQAFGVGIPSQFLSMLPYLTTVVVLVIISRDRTLLRVNTPACLGQSFVPDR